MFEWFLRLGTLLYETIPFLQIQNERINIVGLLWWVLLSLVTFRWLMQIHPFQSSKNLKYVKLFNLVSSGLIVKFIHQYLDDVFILLEIFSGHGYMISANKPLWNWTVFWITFVWLAVFSTLIMGYLVKLYHLDRYVKPRWNTVFMVACTMFVWYYHLVEYPFDYAVAVGVERIEMFWRTYLPLYLCYGGVYLSLWEPKLINWKGELDG